MEHDTPQIDASRPAFSSDDPQVSDWRLQQCLSGTPERPPEGGIGGAHRTPAGHLNSPRSQIKSRSDSFSVMCQNMNQKYFIPLTLSNECLHRDRKRSVWACSCASCQDVLKDPVPPSCGHRLCKQGFSSDWDQSACPGPGLRTSLVQGKTVNLLRSACLRTVAHQQPRANISSTAHMLVQIPGVTEETPPPPKLDCTPPCGGWGVCTHVCGRPQIQKKLWLLCFSACWHQAVFEVECFGYLGSELLRSLHWVLSSSY